MSGWGLDVGGKLPDQDDLITPGLGDDEEWVRIVRGLFTYQQQGLIQRWDSDAGNGLVVTAADGAKVHLKTRSEAILYLAQAYVREVREG